MSIEAFNLAGSATSPVGTVTIYSQHYPLATGALIGVIVGPTALILIVALLVCASVLAGRRKDKSSGLPSILSNDFDNERLAMVWYYKWQRYSGWLVWYQFWIRPIFYLFFFFQEKIPAALDGTTELIPMLVLKGKHFEEKFAVENQQAFWYQDEKEIVSNPCVVL